MNSGKGKRFIFPCLHAVTPSTSISFGRQNLSSDGHSVTKDDVDVRSWRVRISYLISCAIIMHIDATME